MNKKEKLVDSLRIAIDALRNDTIHYNWNEQHSCNAGVVAQACLGLTRQEINSLRAPLFDVIDQINEKRESGNTINCTWKNAIKYGCPITGLSNFEIVNRLEKAGLSKADIVHLEYLENPAILELSGIEKIKETVKEQVDEIVRFEEIPDPSFMGRLFEKKITKKIVEPVYQETVIEKYSADYYAKKKNLILYLSAWVKILTQETSHETQAAQLEARLLNAIADENYELAAELRNQIASTLSI